MFSAEKKLVLMQFLPERNIHSLKLAQSTDFLASSKHFLKFGSWRRDEGPVEGRKRCGDRRPP